MKTQEQISSIIDDQLKSNERRPLGIPREILGEIQPIKNFATIITGIRRCGKSTLLLQILKKQQEESLFLNFEDIRLSGFDTSDFIRLNNEIELRKVKCLFFDEIQNIENWEVFINQKLNEEYGVYLTGSNASMLSVELGTHLTGRHLSYELFPFSYTEFLSLSNQKDSILSFDDYLYVGGMPEHIIHRNGRILQQLIDDILNRDIGVRHGIKNFESLRELTVFLISNIGKPISARKLTDPFGIKSTSTVSEYLSFLKDAYIIDLIPQFDYSFKSQRRNPKKVYVIDLGIFHQTKITFSEDYGRQLENAVFLNLRHRYKEIYFFRKNGECDFVVFKNGKIESCIQVCFRIDEMNMEREFSGLKTSLDYFGLTSGIIITHNQSDSFEYKGSNIQLVPAREYFVTE